MSLKVKQKNLLQMKTRNGFKEERALHEVFCTNPVQQRLGLGEAFG